MQSTETVHTYAPIGNERPEPYPDGFVPDASRWSGREYARVSTLPGGEASIFGDDAPAGEPAPVDSRLTTARTGSMVRYIAADRLPARQLVELRHVTHDPGRLALHGERLHGAVPVTPGAIGAPLDPDSWTSPEPRLYEIRVGAVLVAFDRQHTSDMVHVGDRFAGYAHERSTTHVRAWRVPPAGPPILVYEEQDPQGDEHLIALSALLDEPLETAFLAIADRYASSRPAPPDHRVLQMRAAIERWRFTNDIARHGRQPAGSRRQSTGNRRRRRGGRKVRDNAARRAPRPSNLVRTQHATAA